jgi:hypothetical protein
MGRLFEFITDRFWGDKPEPQITVSLQRIDTHVASNQTDRKEESRVIWKLKLRFENETDAFAADLKLLWPGGKKLFDTQLPYHLDAFQDKVAKFQVERPLPSESLGGDEDSERLWKLLPEEFQKMTLVLSYRSHRGDTFYTKYTLSEGAESCEFSQTPPSELV